MLILSSVTDYEESNFMHAEGLAICIAPNLLRSSDPMSHLAFMGPSTSFVKNLILLVGFQLLRPDIFLHTVTALSSTVYLRTKEKLTLKWRY